MAKFPLVGVSAVVDGVGSFLRDMGKMDSAVSGAADKADNAGGRIGNVGSKFASVGKAAAGAAVAGVAALGAAVVGIGVVSLKTAIEFESAWAGVVKTTDGLVDKFGNLTEAGEEMQTGFRDLAKEVPLAVEELLEIGELGGQLGVAGDDLLEFTEVIAAMGVSTNLTTDAAATGFAQLANVMGTTEKFGSSSFSRLGSSIVALGNTSATTEADILSFAQRMAGASKVAGVTEADMLGISASFTSVGIQAQAGGTAVSKTLLDMNKAVLDGGDQLEIYAATAGMSAEQFGAAWEEDAGAVFGEFVQGLGVAGDDAVAILDALEIKDSQAVRAFLSLAGAGDLVTESMKTANEGWEDNTALATEAETRYKTTESQMILLKNTLKDVGITIGSVLLPWMNKLLQAARPMIDELGKKLPDFLNNVLTPALENLAQFLSVFLPQAFAISRAIIMDVWIPALQSAWNFISANIVPILQTLWDWLAVLLPQALATATEFWSAVLLPALQQVWAFVQESLIPAFVSFVEFLSGVLTVVIAEVSAFVIEMFDLIKAWVVENWPLIQQTIQTVVTTIQTVVETALTAVRTFWEENGAAIMNAVQTAWDTVKTIVETTINTILGIIQAVMLAINGDWDTAWTVLKDTAETTWGLIKDAIETALNFIKDTILPAALSAIQSVWDATWEAIKTKVSEIAEDIKTKISTAMDDIKTKVETAWEDIKVATFTKWNAIKTIVGDKIQAVLDTITGVVSSFKEAGAAIVDAIKQGIEDAWGSLVDGLKGKLDELADLLPFSEPKDPRSPLRGLPKAGAAIVGNILQGLEAAMPALQAELNAALNPMQQSAPVTTIGGNVTTNTSSINIDVVSQPASQPSEQAIYMDVQAALASART